jgi:hypothetical protein
MDRRLSVGVGAGVLVVAALLVWRANSHKANAASSLSSSFADASTAAIAIDAGSTTSAAIDAAPLAAVPEFAPGTRGADGSPVPPLPENAPRGVRFGVVLVTYAGAQGAPPSARSKKDALEVAQKLAIDAKTDFDGAVERGDSGSVKDLGRVPRGVLEPAPEYVLFTMKPGSVSDPLDTPRGFWIVKRTE